MIKKPWVVFVSLSLVVLTLAQSQSTRFTAPPKYNFGQYYPEIPVNAPAKVNAKADYALPVKLESLTNARVFQKNDTAFISLSAAQRGVLSKQGFVVQPKPWLEFYNMYEANRYGRVPAFVTLDSVLHVYHLAFDKMLRDLERQRFAPTLDGLLKGLVAAAVVQLEGSKGSSLEVSSLQALAYVALAAKLIDPKFVVPVKVQDVVAAELKLINAASDLEASPIMALGKPKNDYVEDYSQYRPRGHYTKGVLLGQYFKSLMWLGRINFRLKEASETRTAFVLTKLMTANPKLLESWASLYYPTTFLVGTSDDLGVEEYGAAFGAGDVDLADDAKIGELTQKLRDLPAPKINSMLIDDTADKSEVTQGFRLMGQRFVLDGYAFGQLTYRNVGTRLRQRELPSALDFFAVLNNPTASTILTKETDAPSFEHFSTQLEKTRATFKNLGADVWRQNVYSAWLHTLRSVAFPSDQHNPSYMRTSAWSRKALQSALGSYAELKHDTILYAKQTMAEMGAGGEEYERPRGYVEADPSSWGRLLALTRMTRDGLKATKQTTTATLELLQKLDSMISFLKRIAETELNGAQITSDDYGRIEFFGGWLEELTLQSADSAEAGGTNVFEDPVQAAVIADIASSQDKVLEVGIGRINEMLVVVPNGKGKLQVARGGVFSYYEFEHPRTDRLTDERWREMLKKKQAPAQPAWTSSFTVK
jgi:hypothetical protein